MNRWPAWADVFPNITLLPKIEAKTFIMHVSHAVCDSIDTLLYMRCNLHTNHLSLSHSRQVALPYFAASVCLAPCSPCSLAKSMSYTLPYSLSCWQIYRPLHCSVKVWSNIPITKLHSLQGDMDEVVPFAHGQALHAAAKNPYPPLWAYGYGHQNLEFCKQYLPSLHEYLRKLFGRDFGML